MYTEYVFDSKKIDVALCQIKAAIFDIISGEQEKIASVREKANNMQDDDIKEVLGRLCVEQEECVQRLMAFSNELAKILKKLDSYSRELKRVEDKNNAIIVDDLSRKVELAEQLLSSQPQIRELVEAASNGENIDELIAKMGQAPVEEPQVVQAEEPQMVPAEPQVAPAEPQMVEEPVESHEAAPAEEEKEKEEKKVVMPYNDDISTLKDIPPLTPLNYDTSATPGNIGDSKKESSETAPEGEEKKEERVVMPYNDDISTIDFSKPKSENAPAEGEAPAEETTSEAAPEGEEKKEERVVMPYNDDISTIDFSKPKSEDAPAEGEAPAEETTSEAAPEGEEKKEERVIMPYNDDISTIDFSEPKGEDASAEGEVSAEKEESTEEAKVEEASSEPVIETATDTTEILTAEENVSEAAPVETATESVLPEITTEAVVFTEPVVDTMKNNGPIPVIVPSAPAETESTEQTTVAESTDSDKMVFQKKNADAAKVILTTAAQTSKLRNSLATQEALLNAKGFFHQSDSDMTQKETEIQDMMNQANQLYNDGKVDEAQKMYDDICVMSKTLKPSESVGIAA